MRRQSCDEHVKRVAGCLACRHRARNYQKWLDYQRLQNKPTSAGSARVCEMLRELRAAGYSLDDLAERTGLRAKHLWELCGGDLKFVQLRTYHVVEKVYTELRCFPGPSSRAAGVARRNGWTPPPPLPMPADFAANNYERRPLIVDEVVVERLVNGERCKANKYERIEAVRVLRDKGVPVGHIAARLRMNESRVREVLDRLDADEKASA